MKQSRRLLWTLVPTLFLLASCTRPSVFDPLAPVDVAKLPHVVQEMVAPPLLPAFDQVAKGGPEVVEVKLTVQEKKVKIAPKTTIWALTFNGSVPGPLIVAHQGDYVQLTLENPSTNTMTHNIDFHAATGAMGGGDLTHVAPGQQATIRFRVTKPGVFVYHCAPGHAMTPLHVTSGMNGAIMVLPRGGLTDENGKPLKFDRAYYVAEQDYYLRKDDEGKYKEYDTPSAGFADMIPVMRSLTPSHLVLNGVESALLGDRAMLAEVGEKVLFITSSCNIDARFHIIGGHADLVWQGGSFNDRPITDQETWMVPGGSAVAALYQFREPGTYAFVDHNLIKADIFQAAGEVKVSGDWDNSLMEQVEPPHAIQ
ncbi:MAG: nitrite reductase, copper-containing [Flavobacteriales bacterium]|nr:nitrite reductase, copper-containing [Flavobacteriales bacterium]MEB2343083.1 copper-containing nitrite reductase [Flavobacteriia bacterium]